MVNVLGDENFHGTILSGLKQRLPDSDIKHAHELGIRGMPDPALLQLASELGRVLLTHDRRTMIDYAYERLAAKEPMSGLVYVPRWLRLGQALDELELLFAVSGEEEIRGHVWLLPL